MTVIVDIADRLYDYTDEEKATEAVGLFQAEKGLNDSEVIDLWLRSSDPKRQELEKAIFDAVDANGTARRANESIPGGVTLSLGE